MANWFYLIGSVCFLIGTLINMASAYVVNQTFKEKSDEYITQSYRGR